MQMKYTVFDQNTRPLLYISLNNKSAYCVIPRSLKRSDKCKWCGRVFWSCSERKYLFSSNFSSVTYLIIYQNKKVPTVVFIFAYPFHVTGRHFEWIKLERLYGIWDVASWLHVGIVGPCDVEVSSSTNYWFSAFQYTQI